MRQVEVKLRSGRYRVPVTLSYNGEGRIFVKFGYNKKLIAEVKAMEGAKYHGFEDPPRKVWSIADTHRNAFQLQYLQGFDPYQRYDAEIIEHKYIRSLYDHQEEFSNFILSVRQCIIAGEMGTGKTLAAIEVMERSGFPGNLWYYIAPKSGIRAVQREIRIWKSMVFPKMMTYEALTKTMKNWVDGTKAPRGVFFDESARAKNPTAQRSQAAKMLADGIRDDWGNDGYIVLMSGAPAPKSPADWWHQCLSKDTWILTSNGPRQIKELISQSTVIRVQDRDYETSGFFKTGIRELYKLETKEGYTLEATLEHKLRKSNGEWCELKDLEKGDTLQLANYSDFDWEGWGSFGDGYILGLLFGDGTIYKTSGKYYGTLQFFEGDYHLIDILKDYIPVDFNVCGDGPWRIHDKYTTGLIREFDFDNKKKITELFESSISSDCMRGFLRGFFDADGTVEKSRLRIGFAQTNKDRIRTVQRMLSYFGIQSKIRSKKSSDSCIGGRKINSSEISYVLYITSPDAVNFENRIGFHHQKKREILRKRIGSRHNWPRKFVTVKSIDYSNTDEVFDITVPEIRAFSANGLLAHNCEIACPGYLKEGDQMKFKKRLAVVVQKQSDMAGGVYPHLETWRDDAKKCHVCGKYADDDMHKVDPMSLMTGDSANDRHPFQASKDEVSYLYERMKGLVLVKFKKDCLDLPDKQFRLVNLEPSQKIMNVARSLISQSSTVIGGITAVRELSDGFQYRKEVSGMEKCPVCQGTRKLPDPVLENCWVPCDGCGGQGERDKYKRIAEQIDCPKDEVIRELLDELSDVGRIVVFAGFTGSVDRCVKICEDYNWATIRVDGRGWYSHLEGDPLDIFQDQQDKHPRVAFVGHPEAGGIGLTLTASPMIAYYSNDFKFENRVQSMDRIHRPGMDLNRGATIVDIVHLPTDQLILDNLDQKRRLQALTMGVLKDSLGSV